MGILVPRLYELHVSVSKNYSVMLPMKVLSSLSTTGADRALSDFADCWPAPPLPPLGCLLSEGLWS